MKTSADQNQVRAKTTVRLKNLLPSLYFVVGQIGWFACVLSAARGIPSIGFVVSAILIAIHLATTPRPVPELKLLGTVVLIGAIWESVPVATGLLVYPDGTVIPHAAPYWILALWGLFAAQFNTSFRWLKPKIALAALLGAIAGPMSFRAGAALGAVRFAYPWPATFVLAIGWGCLMPILVLLARHWDGTRQ